jgi:hypothetical protein
VGRNFGRYGVYASARELRLAYNGIRERHKTYEAENRFHYKRVFIGGAARWQQMAGEQRRNSLFFRGSVQAAIGNLNVFSHVEAGNDLVNQTVFAANTYSTTAVGVSARPRKTWTLQAEVFRNHLVSKLNPQNIFVLESRGVGVSTALAGFEQWSVYFRLAKSFQWGQAMSMGDPDRYIADQIPLVGAVEGIVHEIRMDGNRPAAGIPVTLDEARTTTTDEQGRYRFIDVPEGAHRVALSSRQLPADFNPSGPQEIVISVQPRKTARADLEAVRLLGFEGKVSAPAGAAPLNVMVRLLPGGAYTITDADGNFGFYNLREGDYEVVLDESTLPEFAVPDSPAGVPLTLRHGIAVPGVQFGFTILPPAKPVRKISLP